LKLTRTRWVRPVAFAAIALIAFGCSSSQAEGDGGNDGGNSVAAKVGDVVITNAELDAEVRKSNSKAYQAWYDARKATLDQMLTLRVVDAEVARRGTTQQALQAEISGSAAPVTDAEIQAFFAENQGRMGGKPIEEMTPQIRQFLANQRISQVMGDFVADLKKKAGIKVYLEPPRSEVRIAANDPRKGPEGAPITLVEFSDFQ
jgi:hypothetical protein